MSDHQDIVKVQITPEHLKAPLLMYAQGRVNQSIQRDPVVRAKMDAEKVMKMFFYGTWNPDTGAWALGDLAPDQAW